MILSALAVGCRTNGYDSAHRRHGWWVTCYDTACKQPATKGRFRHGRESGRWRYYNTDRNLVKQELYRKRGKIMHVKMYHEDGSVACRGQAKLLPTSDGLHYYWSGPWLYYNEQGKHTLTEYYEFGRVVRADTIRN
jgi:antitoxin component YwqK of YwqJK toxin-antitoxin module